ncbi:hypothetical protein RND81_09G212400 [Saponaria officinalis]
METWEEEMYWKHFHAMHFYQVLPNDFFDRLVLPSKFAEHMLGKVPKKVSLIGPSGSSWDVEVSMTGNLALVGEGWKDFAKTYNLEENYILMFKYKQSASLEVLIFDQKNLCEKEYSYFVKKGLPKPNDKIDRKRSAAEAASTEMMEVNDDGGGGSDCVLSKKSKNGSAHQGNRNVLDAPRTTPSDDSSGDNDEFDDDPDFVLSDKTRDDVVEVVSSGGRKNPRGSKSCVPTEDDVQDVGIPIEATNSKDQSAEKPSENNTAWSWKLSQLVAMEQTTPPTANGEKELFEAVVLTPGNNSIVYADLLSAEATNGDCPPGTNCSRKSAAKGRRPIRRARTKSVKKLPFKSDTKRLSKEYISNRRPVTEEEKASALRRATEALTEGSFIVVMRPTGVYKRFYLNIPADWVHKNLSCQHQKVVLRVGEKTWVGMFHNYGRRGHSGGLATGWKNFALQNNLEDSDVCLFKPASEKDDSTLILDVEIFRVVQETTPLTPLICSM